MTDRELMQMALDALEDVADDAEESHKTVSAIKALRARLANEFNPDWNQVEALQESLREHMAEIQRLRARLAQFEPWVKTYSGGKPNYTEPCERCGEVNPAEIHTCTPKQPEQEPVATLFGSLPVYDARTVMMDQTSHDTPPQREWQGLTDEELLDLADMAYVNDLELLQTLQIKLKEKNTWQP